MNWATVLYQWKHLTDAIEKRWDAFAVTLQNKRKKSSALSVEFRLCLKNNRYEKEDACAIFVYLYACIAHRIFIGHMLWRPALASSPCSLDWSSDFCSGKSHEGLFPKIQSNPAVCRCLSCNHCNPFFHRNSSGNFNTGTLDSSCITLCNRFCLLLSDACPNH